MATYCDVCGSEQSGDGKFCNFCGVALKNANDSKSKNTFLSQSNPKSQARLLSILAFVLVAAVLIVYTLRSASSVPTNSEVNPSSAVEVSRDGLSGRWLGTASNDDGRLLDYELILSQDGVEISGTAVTSDANGSGDASIRGTYSNGTLTLQESGGGETGDWVNQSMCYWQLDLELAGTNTNPRLSGTYQGIGCSSSGEITLYRAN